MAFPAKPDGTFQRWLTEHHAMLGKIARAYASSPTAIQELENEMLYQVWRSMPSFSGEAKESTWIYRVCLNTAMTWRRDTSRRDQRFDPSSDTQTIAADAKSPQKRQATETYSTGYTPRSARCRSSIADLSCYLSMG